MWSISGWSVTFENGDYDAASIIDSAFVDDDMSSMRVIGDGCQVVLYNSADFTTSGPDSWSATFTTGEYMLADLNAAGRGFVNDQLSSFKVHPVSSGGVSPGNPNQQQAAGTTSFHEALGVFNELVG